MEWMMNNVYDRLIKPVLPAIIGIGFVVCILFLICKLMDAVDTEERIWAVIKTVISLGLLIAIGIIAIYGFTVIGFVIFAVFLLVLLAQA